MHVRLQGQLLALPTEFFYHQSVLAAARMFDFFGDCNIFRLVVCVLLFAGLISAQCWASMIYLKQNRCRQMANRDPPSHTWYVICVCITHMCALRCPCIHCLCTLICFSCVTVFKSAGAFARAVAIHEA